MKSTDMPESIALIIDARRRDIGGFEVGRVLPVAQHRMVGPFIFFDHMGPAAFSPGQGLDVRPHPHIGLATVTYMFEGEIMHRDSLGISQAIRPGDVNWMVSGRGIVHSERTGDAPRQAGQRVHGIQSWVALPKTHEDMAPRFDHHPAANLPLVQKPGARLRIIAGMAFGKRSPVRVFSDTLYVDADLEAGARLSAPIDHPERAIYVATGAVRVDGFDVNTGQMAVLTSGAAVVLEATQLSRVMVLGGAPMDGPRLIWWNFVASEQSIMDKAKADWTAAPSREWRGRFTLPPNEHEYIPLPEA